MRPDHYCGDDLVLTDAIEWACPQPHVHLSPQTNGSKSPLSNFSQPFGWRLGKMSLEHISSKICAVVEWPDHHCGDDLFIYAKVAGHFDQTAMMQQIRSSLLVVFGDRKTARNQDLILSKN